MSKVYKNSTELMQVHGVPIYMQEMVDACLYGRLNLFLQGDTGSGKTQLARDAMTYFGDKAMFILGRNDMDTRELFQQINLGKLYTKPTHNLEPLINPNTGEVEYYYPKIDEKGIFVYQRLTKQQAEIVKNGLERIAGNSDGIKELTSRIKTKLICVDELPNCVSAVRAQLFNIFDGFIEINGKAYPFGEDKISFSKEGEIRILPDGVSIAEIQSLREQGYNVRSFAYSVGIATGNIGQKFTESSNELGRALKDRMHVIVDTDYFAPAPRDTLEILAGNTNPRVEFSENGKTDYQKVINQHKEVVEREVPLEKLLIANYLLHGLDYCSKGSKRKMKDSWPTALTSNEQGSDIGLVLPVSPRAAKSIIRLSQALDKVAEDKGVSRETIEQNYFDSMMQAYKFVSAYSGVLNDATVDATYSGDKYKALDAIITTTRQQFVTQEDNIRAGFEMVASGKTDARVLNKFTGRWQFMKDTLEHLVKMQSKQ